MANNFINTFLSSPLFFMHYIIYFSALFFTRAEVDKALPPRDVQPQCNRVWCAHDIAKEEDRNKLISTLTSTPISTSGRGVPHSQSISDVYSLALLSCVTL